MSLSKTQIEKLFNYWKKEADYSFDVAQSLFKSKKYAESLFFGHLALEKILKAFVVVSTKEHAPFIHNLVRLAELSALPFEKHHIQRLELYNEFYMSGRYDQDKMNFRKKCTVTFTNKHLEMIKKEYLWLKQEITKISL